MVLATCAWFGWKLIESFIIVISFIKAGPPWGYFRAYSFCAVFLFRFINRNRNRRVQKERLSFERNNFHGNKMVHCLISNWKGKKYEKIIRKRNWKEKRATFSTDSLSSPTPLSSSFFLVSLRTCIHGYQQEMESCCCVYSRPFRREKRWERCGTRRRIVCCAFRRSWGDTSTKASGRTLFSRLLTKTRKETKTSMLQHKKNKDPDPLVCICISTTCRVPAYGKPT